MNSEPSTPTQSIPQQEEDVGGPGLFSAPRNPHADMERPGMHSEAESGSVSEKSSTGHAQDEESFINSASAHTGKAHDAPATKPHSVTKQSTGPSAMGPPPPKPDFRATPTSAQPSQPREPNTNQDAPTKSKGNGGRKPTTSAIPAPKESTKTATRKRSHGEIAEPRETDEDDESDEEFNEPSNPIGEFDWEDLESRYHQRMGQLGDQEQELYHSFGELIDYFSIWSQTGHHHEVDRGCKRLKTQMTLVQHHEQELESKRQHYVKVVEAFKSALHLLTGD